MKTRTLLIPLAFPCALVLAEEPAPKLGPRPIPGMPAIPAVPSADELFPAFKPREPKEPPPLPEAPAAPVVSATPDRARILYIHRRATLPPDLTRDLPAIEKKAATPASAQLQVRQSAVKIIPKSEVGKLITPKKTEP